jgi:chitin disaccharide deacetylase
MSVASRSLVLCADDFGLAPGISAGIAALAARSRLSAVSCIVNSPHWRGGALMQRQWPASVSRGLHLNLSEGAPLSAVLRAVWPVLPALPRLLALAPLRRLPRAAIRAEIEAQLDAFGEATGRAPDFVDGHQHVHHLPGVRESLLDIVGALQPRPAVRSTARLLGPGAGFKGRVIEATGGRALGAMLERAGFVHNQVLLGAYDFQAADYRALMQRWLAALPASGALLFCHPGEAVPGDAIGAARQRELAYFASAGFDADLAAAGVLLVPFSGTSTPG